MLTSCTDYILTEDVDTGRIEQVYDRHDITKKGDTIIVRILYPRNNTVYGHYKGKLPKADPVDKRITIGYKVSVRIR